MISVQLKRFAGNSFTADEFFVKIMLMQPEENNPYAFIMSDPSQNARGSKTSGSTKTRIIIVVIVGVVILIVGIVGFSLLTKGSGDNSKPLLSVAQQQAEIIRVAGIGQEKSRNPDIRSLSITTKLSFTTSEQQLVGLLKKKTKVSESVLSLGKDSKVDTTLAAASLDNRFDEVYKKIITTKLNDYQTSLSQLQKGVLGLNEKKILESSFNQTGLILNKKS